MAHVETFRNTRTGRTLAANPGSHAHTRMTANPVQFERVEHARPPKRSRKTPKPPEPPEGEQATADSDHSEA